MGKFTDNNKHCRGEFCWHVLEEALFREEVSILSREGRKTAKPIKAPKERGEHGREDVEALGRAVCTALEYLEGTQGPGDYL